MNRFRNNFINLFSAAQIFCKNRDWSKKSYMQDARYACEFINKLIINKFEKNIHFKPITYI